MTREEKRQRHEAMKAYKAEGHSLSEVAEKFGVSEGLAHRVCKGIAPQSDRRPKKYRNQYSYDTPEGVEERARKMVEKYAPSFEYAGNYTGSEGFCDIRCKECGTVQKKSVISIRHRTARCDACYMREIEERKAEKKAETEAKKKERAEKAAWNRYEKSIKQTEFVACKQCGKLFIVSGGRKAYCSEECAKKATNKAHKDKRISKMKAVIIDRDIRLDKLARRDHDVCALCGGLVDWTDYWIRKDGTFIAGQDYPSIDHIVPLSHKGTEAWDNVQLAHRRCNSLKGDHPPVAETPA